MIVPKDLEDCYCILKEQMLLNDQQDFTKCSEGELIKYHHTLGQWMRNEWGLWATEDPNPLAHYFLTYKRINHADDMSHEILRYCWRRFREDESKKDQEEERIKNKDW